MSFRPSSYCAAHCRANATFQAPSELTTATLTRPATGGMVLAVDNQQADLSQLQEVLTSHGYRCLPCSTPAEAIAAAQAHDVHALVCAAELAGESGVSLYTRLLMTRRTFVPAVFLSSSQTADVIRRPIDGCGTYFLRRPCSSAVLLPLLQRLQSR